MRDIRFRDAKSCQHTIEIFQRLPGLYLEIVLADSRRFWWPGIWLPAASGAAQP
ncbi:hypothetical protein [Glaciimonas sp. PCH181]|uniref:hypothetical protein n=1 Tax=Glaciimonas sp. PCH181 TaxID=2133943 RepID=UPI001CEDC1C1|nr:hypothetical protein [Glaciimonas sp. PCH181]